MDAYVIWVPGGARAYTEVLRVDADAPLPDYDGQFLGPWRTEAEAQAAKARWDAHDDAGEFPLCPQIPSVAWDEGA